MKVLITRPLAQAASFARALKNEGFEPVFFPVIEIQPYAHNAPLDQAIKELNSYHWVIFTSANSVKVFFDRLSRTLGGESVKAIFSSIKTAVIGPKTAAALQQVGITPDYLPTQYIAEAILPGLGDLHNCRVLLPRANAARAVLPDMIRAAGGTVTEISLYQTLQPEPDPVGLSALQSGVDLITFTSSSTVRNFVTMLQSLGIDPLHLPHDPPAACIGPITAGTARQLGFENILVATDYTSDGLVKLIRSIT